MVETIIKPEQSHVHVEFDLPDEFIGREVKVTFSPVEEKKDRAKMGDFWGILSDETANELRKNVEQTGIDWEERIEDIWKNHPRAKL